MSAHTRAQQAAGENRADRVPRPATRRPRTILLWHATTRILPKSISYSVAQEEYDAGAADIRNTWRALIGITESELEKPCARAATELPFTHGGQNVLNFGDIGDAIAFAA